MRQYFREHFRILYEALHFGSCYKMQKYFHNHFRILYVITFALSHFIWGID